MLVCLIKIQLVVWLQQANPKKERKNNFISENKFSDTNKSDAKSSTLSIWCFVKMDLVREIPVDLSEFFQEVVYVTEIMKST